MDSLTKQKYCVGQQAVISHINGDEQFKRFLFTNGISKGTTFKFNYSPNYAKLINISIDNKIISLRKDDFKKIDWE